MSTVSSPTGDLICRHCGLYYSGPHACVGTIVGALSTVRNFAPNFKTVEVAMAEPSMTFKPLFGAPDEAAQVKTTPLGIRVQAHGYDEPLEGKALRKRLKKSLAYLDSLGCSGNVQTEFEHYLHAFPESVMNWWIDSGYLAIVKKWQACRFSSVVAGQITPKDIEITLVPAPFWVPLRKTYAVGMTDPNAKGEITICVAAVSKATPESVAPDWLRRVDDLARWEIGNYFAFRAGIKDREIGDGSPC